ncbi:MAG: hypothetical protein ACE5GD_11510, partial [Candidatus Geothermarchaeales archaeon]
FHSLYILEIGLRSFIKIYGPPLGRALDELRKTAHEMPEIMFYYHYVLGVIPVSRTETAPLEEGMRGFGESYKTKVKPSIREANSILGEYDFFFEWETDPTPDQLRTLIEKIDKALSPLGCKYTITTK